MCVSADTSAAAAQAADGSANVMACRSCVRDLVTMHSASRCPGTIDAASLMSARTGVIPRVPMISALVISAPSQCDRSMSSRPETPGKRYLLPPEKPTTSCGNTGLDDERDVVLDHGAVDPDVSGVVQHAIGQLGDPVRH